MERDYRKTKSGLRRFNNPEMYKKSLEFQEYLKGKGIAWHNVFADECTSDMSCCEGDGDYIVHFPSYYGSAKQLFKELFEKIKYDVDDKTQNWLWNEMQKFLKEEVLWDEP